MLIDPTTNKPFENPEIVLETPEISKWDNAAQRKLFIETFGPSTSKDDLKSFLQWIEMRSKFAAESVELDVVLFSLAYQKLLLIHTATQRLLLMNPTVEQCKMFLEEINKDLYNFFQEIKK